MSFVYKLQDVVDDPFFGRKVIVEFSKQYLGEKYAYTVGNFNAFFPGSFRMHKSRDRFYIRIPLPEGIWYYLFYTPEGFKLDAENPFQRVYENIAYNFSSTVNVCSVKLQDGTLEDIVYHRTTPLYVFSIDEKIVYVRLRISKELRGDPFIILKNGKIRMKLITEDELFSYYEVLIPFKRTLEYSFNIETSQRNIHYGPFTIDFDDLMGVLKAPDWAYDLNFYQIMIDRYCPKRKFPDKLGHLGGDINCLLEKLKHINDLGVKALYLTPIFESRTYHSYDVEDYYNIARKYGGNEAFVRLLKKAKDSGIKIFLDGVFHHTSFFNPFFQEALIKGQSSKYFHWYRIHSNEYDLKRIRKFLLERASGINSLNGTVSEKALPYETFFGVWLMPKLNHENPEVKAFVRDVINYWINEYEIHGWRLDVAHGIPPEFWEEVLGDLLDKYYLFGEVMDDGRIWIHKCFNGLMNYVLYKYILEYFVYKRISSEEFLKRLMLLRVYYGPYEHLMYNFLDNHDVSRFLGLLSGDVDRYLCALVFLYTYTGIPSIFYGDEIGLKNVKLSDEEQREPMNWDKNTWNKTILDTTRALIRLRNSRIELRRGIFIPIRFKKDVLDYVRVYKGNKIRVIINYSGAPVQRAILGKILLSRNVSRSTQNLITLYPKSYALIDIR